METLSSSTFRNSCVVGLNMGTVGCRLTAVGLSSAGLLAESELDEVVSMANLASTAAVLSMLSRFPMCSLIELDNEKPKMRLNIY
jgi:hypothetical protein